MRSPPTCAKPATLGVNGVPFFVIDRRFGVSGAQASEVFAQTLARARSHRAAS